MTAYESVIGLEVHAQLKTRSKIFCGCPTRFGAPPNTSTCAVCLGHPGALPVLNRHVVELGVRGALALGAEVHQQSVFARKNYFYPDLPKGYQISQFENPLASGGAVEIEVRGRSRKIGLIRLHLEEDAGKSVQDGMPDSDRRTYVDLNRAGVPLAEIVSQPDLRSPEEAYLYLERMRSILRYADVCDGNMEEGSLRCDANVSIRPVGQQALGTRTELKNLNSFRNVQRALEYEIERQIELVRSGGEVEQMTVLWDESAGVTRAMRGKEEAHDYRYFPEPDLLPVRLDPNWIAHVAGELPELPAVRKRRLSETLGLADDEAHRLTLDLVTADYFERVAVLSGNPRAAANFVLNDLVREQGRAGAADDPPPSAHLAELIRMIDAGKVSITVARQELFPALCRDGTRPGELASRRGLEQVDDETALVAMIRRVLEEHPEELERYRGGKTGLLGFFVGKVMAASGGKANPRTLNDLLRKEIA